jgi:hypothetical protein
MRLLEWNYTLRILEGSPPVKRYVVFPIAALTCFLPPVTRGASPTVSRCILASNGSWNSAGSWDGPIPDAPSAEATFNYNAALASNSDINMTLGGNETAGHLQFNSNVNFTINGNTGGKLTLGAPDDPENPASITVYAGSDTIAVPLVLKDGLTVTTEFPTFYGVHDGNLTADLTIAGPVTGSGTLTAVGEGRHDLTDGTAVMVVSPSGSIHVPLIAHDGVDFAANTASGILVQSLPSLTLTDGSVVTLVTPLSPSARTLLITSSLNFPGSSGAWLGRLDLTENDLLVRGGNYSQILDQVRSGAQINYTTDIFGLPQKGGLFSSSMGVSLFHAPDTNAATPLAVVQAKSTTIFDGESVSVGDVLVKYTTPCDANFDGITNAADYISIDNGFAHHLQGWENGDFNYDGVVDGSDYSLLDNAIDVQNTAPASEVSMSSVPEPRLYALLAMMLTVIGCARRKIQSEKVTSI